MGKIRFTFVDLFAGIGGFKMALSNNGGHCVAFSEINKDAINTYCSNFKIDPRSNLGDIKKIRELPQHDILTAGVPCQSWSIAGKNLGFSDDRGRLWDDTIFLLQQAQPKVFISENVKGLADPRNRQALSFILNLIENAGYYSTYFVINSSDYGVPQNRVRIYIVGFKEKKYFYKFKLPEPCPSTISIGSLLGIKTPEKTESLDVFFQFNDLRDGPTTIHSWELLNTTQRQKEICLLLLKNRRKSIYGYLDGNALSLQQLKALDPSITQPEIDALVQLDILKAKDNSYDFKNKKISIGLSGINRIFLPTSKVFSTLVASDTNDFIALKTISSQIDDGIKERFIEEVYKPGAFRKITKREACLIQGFPTDFELPESRSRWMKLLGNSVSVPVIEIICKAILDTGVFDTNHNS